MFPVSHSLMFNWQVPYYQLIMSCQDSNSSMALVWSFFWQSCLVSELNSCAVPTSLLQVAQGPVSVRWSTSVVNRVECAVTSSPLIGTAWDADMLFKPRGDILGKFENVAIYYFWSDDLTFWENIVWTACQHSKSVPTTNTNLWMLCSWYFVNGLTHGYTLLFAAHEVKSLLVLSWHAFIEPYISLSDWLCCTRVHAAEMCVFAFSLSDLVLTIRLLIFLFRAGIQCKCQQVGDFELRESISPSGWNLTFVSRGLLKTSITVVVLNVIVDDDFGTSVKNQIETLISLSALCFYGTWPRGWLSALPLHAANIDCMIFFSFQGGSESAMPNVSSVGKHKRHFLSLSLLLLLIEWQHL